MIKKYSFKNSSLFNFPLFFLFLLVTTIGYSQMSSDCVNSITVCGNAPFEYNPIGIGLKNEIKGCGAEQEHNTVWLKIFIIQGGTLGFNLIPNDPAINTDYDFYVYGPNKNCSDLGTPIRCCATNPNEAGLTSNSTGMNGTISSNTSGPGANGSGFVKWLDVTIGDVYYIAIDRHFGEGGFKLEWIGTATTGTGAFPIPPTTNEIPDYVTCTDAVNNGVAIFSFDDSFKNTINSDPNTEINIFLTQQDAIDNVNPLDENSFGLYVNVVNPQKVYARVTSLISNCYSLTNFNLVVTTMPEASFEISKSSICAGEEVAINFSGTPNAIVNYTINENDIQTATLDDSGIFTLPMNPLSETTVKLKSVDIQDSSGITSCRSVFNITKIIAVNPLPTATISGTTTINAGDTAILTVTGTPNSGVYYTKNGVETGDVFLNQTGYGIITTKKLNVDTVYELVNITTYPSACSQSLSSKVTVTVTPNTKTNDCVNAIAIDGNDFGSKTFTPVGGIGAKQEVNACSGFEHNSIWFKVDITKSGTFGFDLIPVDTDLQVDYDFWVYGPNKECGSLGTPIRCNTTNPFVAGFPNNHTGMDGIEIATNSGPGANGNGYVRWLDAKAGETYFIVIDNVYHEGGVDTGKTKTETGFKIQTTGTATIGSNLAISDFNKKNNIIISPNPVVDQININIDNTINTKDWTVTIINTLGQIVYKDNIDQQQFSISTSNWGKSGLYFIKINDASNNMINTQKVILK